VIATSEAVVLHQSEKKDIAGHNEGGAVSCTSLLAGARAA